jgi:hypothetical protein
MASDQGAMHGGSRKNAGRKKVFSSRKEYRKLWEKEHRRIYLSAKIFDTWQEAKIRAGYERSSDTDFAAHLLSLEFRRR